MNRKLLEAIPLHLVSKMQWQQDEEALSQKERNCFASRAI